jgi:hypothetical protein
VRNGGGGGRNWHRRLQR